MKLRLLVAYDGTAFRGFQSQTHGRTVQDTLEEVIAVIVGERVILHASGRTDAGVHALGQTIHFELTPEQVKRIGRMGEPERWMAALNSSLPQELRVMKVSRASKDFHARFSTRGKIYRYDIWHDSVLPPHLVNRAWHLFGSLDCSLIRDLAGRIEGAHDFRGFCADSGSLPESTVRTIRRALVTERGSSISITLEGDGFLYRMVRMLVGGMVRVAQGKEDPGIFLKRLADGKPWPTPAMAPAHGLYLVKALYGRQRGMGKPAMPR
jgi:tRNA pseudouridine38-40 synthase